MKKSLLTITGLSVIALVFTSLPASYSATSLPYPTVGQKSDPPACQQVAANQTWRMRQAWHQSLEALRDEEKPASAKVDEAFESMRTYRCWLDYLCEVVAYSSVADPDEADISSQNIEPIPGCAPVEELEIPEVTIDFIPECQTNPASDVRLAEQIDNYNRCRDLIGLEFVESPDTSTTDPDASTAFITVERALKSDSSQQKNNALQRKLGEILNKMYAMETHMNLLKEQFFSFDSLYACVAEKCD